ncbi:hypothetical protein HELRODRAFT_174220 [Helobdella robusta]|uniref:Uncharacterized protein n=2 Tax=Helobdella robusta TaxID=6412 RepID=T1F7T9_HELRO|nr:hypothetical protein HELRODRAFT_174220 [Helobdella robusta]ESO02802.1 hypothetical protein HELRODRAFT_174220 [Helobdella robusta]
MVHARPSPIFLKFEQCEECPGKLSVENNLRAIFEEAVISHDDNREDFGLKAEWHFFATSHGKSPCDGIGGTTKRLVARASLQASTKDQILNAKDFYTYADAKINGIKFFWVDKKEIKDLLGMLEKRFRSADKIKGCRSHHSFIPDKNDQLLMKRLSSDLFGYNFNKNESEDTNDDYEPGRFVALVYDKKWYLGNIIERDDKNDDLKVNCLKKFKENIFYWPKNVDICYVPFKHILILIPDDNISYVGKIHITLPETVFKHISTLYNNFKLKKKKLTLEKNLFCLFLKLFYFSKKANANFIF